MVSTVTAAALTSLTAGSVRAWAWLRRANTSHDLTPTGLQVEFINPIFEFSRAMRRLGLDDAEYALLIAINIFSADRPNVQEPSRVEALQQPYVEALLSYTRIKRPQVAEPSPRLSRRHPGPGRGEGWGEQPCRPTRGWVLLPRLNLAMTDPLAPAPLPRYLSEL